MKDTTTWTSTSTPPANPGYYSVLDFDGKTGTAFMNKNKTWHDAKGGSAKKPYEYWAVFR